MRVKNIIGIMAGAVVAYLLLNSLKTKAASVDSSNMVWVNGQLVPVDSLFNVSDVTTLGSQGVGQVWVNGQLVNLEDVMGGAGENPYYDP